MCSSLSEVCEDEALDGGIEIVKCIPKNYKTDGTDA